jgi:hypothetical protein
MSEPASSTIARAPVSKRQVFGNVLAQCVVMGVVAGAAIGVAFAVALMISARGWDISSVAQLVMIGIFGGGILGGIIGLVAGVIVGIETCANFMPLEDKERYGRIVFVQCGAVAGTGCLLTVRTIAQVPFTVNVLPAVLVVCCLSCLGAFWGSRRIVGSRQVHGGETAGAEAAPDA